MTTCRHWAYNLRTGEVLGSTTGNSLRRHIQRNERWNIRHGYGKGEWRFYHGAYEGLRLRVLGA